MDETFFSQHGEDFILSRHFARPSGYFVEVGCIDGKRFSNTLYFERKGWKGLCVEAHAGYIEMIKANRPGSVVVHAAAGEGDEEAAPFYANARGTLSSLDPTTEERWKRDYAEYFTGFEKQTVAKRTLTSIFQEHKAPQIDILSLDIEGYEVEALSGLDLRRFKPSVMVIESDSPAHQGKIHAMLEPHGYRLALDYAGSVYYSVLPEFERAVANQFFPGVKVTHTLHPLDKGGDKVISFDIDTRPRAPAAKPRGLGKLFGGLTRK